MTLIFNYICVPLTKEYASHVSTGLSEPPVMLNAQTVPCVFTAVKSNTFGCFYFKRIIWNCSVL